MLAKAEIGQLPELALLHRKLAPVLHNLAADALGLGPRQARARLEEDLVAELGREGRAGERLACPCEPVGSRREGKVVLLRRDLEGRDNWRDRLEASVSAGKCSLSVRSFPSLKSLDARQAGQRELIVVTDVAIFAYDEEAELRQESGEGQPLKIAGREGRKRDRRAYDLALGHLARRC